MTVRQIEQRLQGLSPWQRQQFGARPDEIRRRFVDEVLVPEMLLVAGAKARHLADAPHETAIQMIRVLSGASLRNVRQPLEAAEVSKDEAQTFYQDNLSKFQQPERIGIWRILCKTQETARSVIEAASKELTTAKFQELAREHSLDKATMYRGGNLGFVTAEGLSTEAGIKVDNTVVSAALGVKDGELVMKPVSEGENFAVVFRRGTVPASKRTLAEALPQIRETLRRRKIESAERAFLAGLREKHLREVHPELVDAIELKVDDTPVVQKGTPASSAPVPSRP
jgi:peptidyl-prolyl cis-trans isomerase C